MLLLLGLGLRFGFYGCNCFKNREIYSVCVLVPTVIFFILGRLLGACDKVYLKNFVALIISSGELVTYRILYHEDVKLYYFFKKIIFCFHT